MPPATPFKVSTGWVQREIFCVECGEEIDYERRIASFTQEEGERYDLYILAESVEDHRQETGCPADGGWRASAWTECPEDKVPEGAVR